MKPLLLMILDGWGHREEREGNAIALAKTPNWDSILKTWPHTTLDASGLAVGLPEGTMGNSEVGHLNIGAGRVVHQEYTRINKSIEDGSFFKNKALDSLLSKLNKGGGALHLMGLVSDIGVHSHLNHLYALIDLAVKKDIQKIFIHCFTDGRDSPPDSGIKYIKAIDDKISAPQYASVRIATVMGRFYAMDRDKRWERIAKAYDAIVDGAGKKVDSALDAVKVSYDEGVTDEFIIPTIVRYSSIDCHPCGSRDPTDISIKDGDAVIFFNFRADRARELTRAMTDENFTEFRRRRPKLSAFMTMTQYDEKFKLPVIFSPEHLTNIFGGVVAASGMRQLRIAETEKYAHVTYFFNGGDEQVFKNEDRVLIPSPRDVDTYDKKPQMSAMQVVAEVVKRIESGKYEAIVLNFANPDMVGHTGNLAAAIKAVETVDDCIGQVVSAVRKAGGAVLITGDHGNCEEMKDKRGNPQTAHTTELVPFVVVGKGLEEKKLRSGRALCDIAPTMLNLMGLKQPKEMTGENIII